MKITKLHIQNYKSIQNLELINPKPFSVFVGPNGAGKSNIFEALEFVATSEKSQSIFDVVRLFGGEDAILRRTDDTINQSFFVESSNGVIIKGAWSKKELLDKHWSLYFAPLNIHFLMPEDLSADYRHFIGAFARIFLNNSDIKKRNFDDDSRLNADASNVEKVLNRILKDEAKREEIIEWMRVLVPEFEDIKFETSTLSGEVNYVVFEKHTQKPFNKHLLSNGTKNILALLTAVYQSDEPQFLCIEEPENGLHPHAIRDLVSLFRSACEEKGHYIWLNTHSETLVRQLSVDEIIVVDKKNGATQAKQFQGRDVYGLQLDEAWLTNMLGGGLP